MKLKQLSVFFVISLFLLSAIPLSFAEERNGSDVPVPTLYIDLDDGINESDDDKDESDSDDDSGDDSDDNSEDADDAPDYPLRTREQLSPQLIDEDRRAGQVVEARQRFVDARERLENIKKRYLEKRAIIVKHKVKLNACRNDDSEDCEKSRFIIKQNAGAFLSHSADMVLNALEKLRNKVISAEDIDSDSRTELISDITSLIDEVRQAKMTAEQLTESSTNEEVNEAARTIRSAWGKVKTAIKIHTSRLMHAKLGNIVARSERLLERLEKTSDKLEAQGKDVSELDSLLLDLDSQLESANEHYEDAVEAFKEARDSDDVASSMKEFQRHFSLAKEELKKAQITLRAAVKEIRSLNDGTLIIEPVRLEETPEDESESDEEELETEEEEELEVEELKSEDEPESSTSSSSACEPTSPGYDPSSTECESTEELEEDEGEDESGTDDDESDETGIVAGSPEDI